MIKSLVSCIMVAVTWATAANELQDHALSVIEQQFIGKWQGARHTDWFLADHTWFMDFEPGDKPRGTWHIDGGTLTKTYSEGGSATYRIVSISAEKLVIADVHDFQYTLKRVP